MIPCIQLILKIIENFPEESNSPDTISRSSLLLKLQNEHNIFDIIFNNIKLFKEFSSNLFHSCGPNNSFLSRDLADSYIISGRFSFIENVNERLHALKSLFSWCREFKLTTTHVDLLWECFYRNGITTLEQNSIITWFKNISGFDKCENTFIDFEVAHYFYESKLLVDLTPALISLDGFLTIKQFFLFINSRLNSICIIKSAKNLEEFVITNYLNLIGLDYLWLLALEVVNPNVLTSTLEFIGQLHEKLSPDLQYNIVEIRKNYLKKCFEFLKDCSSLQNYSKMVRCLSLITALLDSSEKKGFGGPRSHGALLLGVPILLHVEHFVAKSSKTSKFDLHLSLNDSLWELRLKIAKELSWPCDSIRLISNAMELGLELNSKMLHELKFKNHQKIMVSTFSNQALQVELLFNNELTLEASRVLEEIFAQYASVTVDNDIFSRSDLKCVTNSVFNESDSESDFSDKIKTSKTETIANQYSAIKYFSRGDMAKYILACGANESCANESRLNNVFNQYGENLQIMKLSGFQRFYRDAVLERPAAVWNDINVHGYRYDLRKESAVAEEELNLLNSSLALNLPRNIISSTPEYFNTLFDALHTPDSLVTAALWSLLQRLPTNFELLNSLTKLDFTSSDSSYWSHFLDPNNFFKLLYSLQIIESMTEPVRPSISKKNNTEDDELIQSRNDWRKLFISSGGLVHLFDVLVKFRQSENSLLYSTTGVPFKQFINTFLKLFSNFVFATIATNYSSLFQSLNSLFKLSLHETEKCSLFNNKEFTSHEKVDADDNLDFDVPNKPTETPETFNKNIEDSFEIELTDILMHENQLGSDSANLVEQQINFTLLLRIIFHLVSTCISVNPDDNSDLEIVDIFESFGKLLVSIVAFKFNKQIYEILNMFQESTQIYFWAFLTSNIKKYIFQNFFCKFLEFVKFIQILYTN